MAELIKELNRMLGIRTKLSTAFHPQVHMVTKVSPFMANYRKKLRMGGDIRRKGKVESATEFVERMKKVHEEAETVLRKTREEMKRYVDRGRKKTEEWKKGDRVLLSTKDLVLKERPTKKLMERYVVLYAIKEIVSLNAVKLRLPSSMRIHLVVNVSWIVRYKEQVKGQKKEEGKLVVSQIRYSLVVILGLNSVSEVQYKGMMTDR